MLKLPNKKEKTRHSPVMFFSVVDKSGWSASTSTLKSIALRRVL